MNSKAKLKRSRTSGFSVLELVIVVAVILIAGAIAIPNAIRIWYGMELRATGNEVADMMQRARILAARSNSYYTVCYTTSGGVQTVYLTQVTLSSSSACTYTAGTSISIDLARMITAASGAPTGSNPSAYTSSIDTSSGTPCDNTCTLAFSPRGLPCQFVTGTPGTCTTPAASYFVYYFQASSSNGWAAVAVSKAGRTQTYTWNGSSWN